MSKNSVDAHGTGLCISCENLSKCIVYVTENVELVHGYEENSLSIKSDWFQEKHSKKPGCSETPKNGLFLYFRAIRVEHFHETRVGPSYIAALIQSVHPQQ